MKICKTRNSRYKYYPKEHIKIQIIRKKMLEYSPSLGQKLWTTSKLSFLNLLECFPIHLKSRHLKWSRLSRRSSSKNFVRIFQMNTRRIPSIARPQMQLCIKWSRTRLLPESSSIKDPFSKLAQNGCESQKSGRSRKGRYLLVKTCKNLKRFGKTFIAVGTWSEHRISLIVIQGFSRREEYQDQLSTSLRAHSSNLKRVFDQEGI